MLAHFFSQDVEGGEARDFFVPQFVPIIGTAGEAHALLRSEGKVTRDAFRNAFLLAHQVSEKRRDSWLENNGESTLMPKRGHWPLYVDEKAKALTGNSYYGLRYGMQERPDYSRIPLVWAAELGARATRPISFWMVATGAYNLNLRAQKNNQGEIEGLRLKVSCMKTAGKCFMGEETAKTREFSPGEPIAFCSLNERIQF